MYDLSGKVALVTGAGGERGIGRAIAVRLAQEGADVVVNDVAEQPYTGNSTGWRGLPDVVREIEALGREALAVVADVSDAGQVKGMVAQSIDRFGHIDILVNNAGSRPGKDRMPIVDLDEEAFDLVQRVNVKGAFLCSKAVARAMIDRGEGGKIIVMSSVAGKEGIARYGAYCTSKFALVGFTQVLAIELAPYKINVNAICPTLVDTERVTHMASALKPENMTTEAYRPHLIEQFASQVPLGRIAQPDDVARTAAFLASSQADFLTGLAVNVAGGMEMR